MGKRLTIWVVLLLATAAATASARTWYVRKDGAGDYTVIQDAVDQAAAGDTVRIGPGQYPESAPLVIPGWTENVCVAIQIDNLTLIGAGADLTRIGPSLAQKEPMPKGIAAVFVRDLTVAGLTVENIRDGLYCGEGHLEVRECTFHNCSYGIGGWTDGGMLVEHCQFDGNTGSGITTYSPSRGVVISDCTFSNNYGGINLVNGTTDAIVQNCHFQGGVVGVQIASHSSGTITDCAFDAVSNTAITIYTSTAVVTNNVVSGGQENLNVDTNCTVSGSGNLFEGGSYATIDVASSPNLSLHRNHILHSAGYSVFLRSFVYTPAVYLDLSNNYWGTSEANQIATWIRDGNDNSGVHAFVTYQPYAGGPVATEAKSWGELKTLYGK